MDSRKYNFCLVSDVIDTTATVTSLCFHRLRYKCSTNAGLCQGNMTWCCQVRGAKYLWVIDLYESLNLPVLPAVVQALEKAVKERAVELEREKSDKAKQGRVRMKVARAEDQEAQKKWLKHQAIEHSYGQDDADDVEPGPRSQ